MRQGDKTNDLGPGDYQLIKERINEEVRAGMMKQASPKVHFIDLPEDKIDYMHQGATGFYNLTTKE